MRSIPLAHLPALAPLLLTVLVAPIPGHGVEEAVPEDTLAPWRLPTGEWHAAADVALDPTNNTLLAAQPGEGVIVNGLQGRTCDILTQEEYGDLAAHVEFVVPRGSNSGVYFMGRYEIQVLDSFGVETPQHSDCGGVYQRWDPARGARNEGYEGHPPRVNAARAPGTWQSFDIVFRAPRFDAAGVKTENARFVRVVHNGVLVHENVEVTGPTRAAHFGDEKAKGPLMLQGDHGPVAYRNFRLHRLAIGEDGFAREVFDEEGFTTVFDGKSLAGWHVSSRTGHSRASGGQSGGRWVVEGGAITGSQDVPGNGGIVLTDREYGDFEVVLEMRNDFGPDSGLFLRSTEEGAAYQYMVDYHADGTLAGLYGEGLRPGFHLRNFSFGATVTEILPGDAPYALPISPADWPRLWTHGEWNELRARIEGNPPTITTWINGVRFMEFADSERRAADTGRIALQVHGGGNFVDQFVRYRAVRVKELTPPEPPGPR